MYSHASCIAVTIFTSINWCVSIVPAPLTTKLRTPPTDHKIRFNIQHPPRYQSISWSTKVNTINRGLTLAGSLQWYTLHVLLVCRPDLWRGSWSLFHQKTEHDIIDIITKIPTRIHCWLDKTISPPPIVCTPLVFVHPRRDVPPHDQLRIESWLNFHFPSYLASIIVPASWP